MKILIIGATSGIGRALCDYYIAHNNEVAVVGRRQEMLEQMREQYAN